MGVPTGPPPHIFLHRFTIHRFQGLGLDSAASSRTETQGLVEVMLWEP